MNKWILIPLAVVAIPVIVAWMWIRHPILCFKELKHSFNLCMRGKDTDA